MNEPGFHSGLFIGGEWVAGAETAPVLDKYSLRSCWDVAVPGESQVARIIDLAATAHRAGAPNARLRAETLDRAAAIVSGRRETFIRIMAVEAGFPARDAEGEVTRCCETLHLSAIAARQLGGELVPLEGAPGGEGRLGFTLRVPVGPVLAVTPFNSPLNTVAHKLGPAFAAGNPVILKPSLHTPATAALLVQCLAEAGVPAGFLALAHGGPEIVRLFLRDERIRYVAFTGSTAAGREIHAAAGLRRTQMELGSIASTVLCEDADIGTALPKVAAACFRKAGQVCTSIQLLHVHRTILDEVTHRLVAAVNAMHVGDPENPQTEIGPMISEAAARRVEQSVGEAVAAGARLLAGGTRKKACLAPTILADVADEMRVSCEELFGPVVSIVPFESFDDVIERINRSPYGLAAGIFTRDLKTALSAAARIEVGGLHINETSSSRLDVMPYGGVKASGFGHEGPSYAARSMTDERLVTIRA